MRWTIGILTVPERELECNRIKGMLEYQMRGYDDIQIIVNGRDGSLGEKRQFILDNATGDYINFVDDDDIVSFDYIDQIWGLLDGKVDYIGFQLQLYESGEKQKPTFHSLKYDKWWDDDKGFYRNVSHLNPIKRQIAKQGRFDGGIGEDQRWADQVHPKTEYYIDKPLYFYFHSLDYSLSLEDN